MITIEQRAHDLAIATAMQFQKIELNAKMANAVNNNNEVNIDVKKTLDIYCNCFDAFCKELAKRIK